MESTTRTNRAIRITNARAVCSYNWVDGDKPVIVVPGMPQKWLARTGSLLLERDTGTYQGDENVRRYAQSPMEPGILAILHLEPEFDFSSLNLIADRHVLSKILDFAHESAEPRGVDFMEFDFSAQVIGATVVFFRSDAGTKKPTKRQGVRQDFDKQFFELPEELQESVSHQRITAYRLGDMNVMVRHAADGYMPNGSAEISEALTNYRPMEEQTETHGDLSIRTAGTLVPLSAMLELNTSKEEAVKSKARKPIVSHPRLVAKIRETWLSQSPHYMAVEYCDKRTFRDDGKIRVGEDDITLPKSAAGSGANSWEDNNQKLASAYYKTLDGLIKRVRISARDQQYDTFKIEKKWASDCIDVEPTKKIPSLPKELCARIVKKTSPA